MANFVSPLSITVPWENVDSIGHQIGEVSMVCGKMTKKDILSLQMCAHFVTGKKGIFPAHFINRRGGFPAFCFTHTSIFPITDFVSSFDPIFVHHFYDMMTKDMTIMMGFWVLVPIFLGQLFV
jgi:hypothetical protein